MMHETDPTVTPTRLEQLTIWEQVKPIEPTDLHSPSDDVIRWTKDLTSLADVPVTMEANIHEIQITKQGVGDTTHTTTELGKVILRMSPHPDFVLHRGNVLPRKDAREADRSEIKPIMVETITTVFYQGGIVKPIHLDVMYALLHGVTKRLETTGVRTGTLSMTKVEIAKIINAKLNGRVRDQIDDALRTLQGLNVIKHYQSPKPGQPGFGQVGETIQSMGGIISNFTIRRAAQIGKVGKPRDVIDVDLNPALINSLTGQSTQRQWSLRTLNLTKTLQITEPWKRQLYRLIDSRFQQVGYLRMPVRELWIGCIGHHHDTVKDPRRWRDARYQLRKVFNEFENTGYVVNFELVHRRRKASRPDDDLTKRELTLAYGEGSATIHAEAPYSLDNEDEWIVCYPGPAFTAEAPKRSRDFALDLAAHLLGKEHAQKAVSELTPEVIIDLSNGRIKQTLKTIGELHKRLPQLHWFDEDMPTSPMPYLVNYFREEAVRRRSCRDRGEVFHPVSAPYFERRMAAVVPAMRQRITADGLNLTAIAHGTESCPDKYQDLVSCIHHTVREIARTECPDPRVHDPELRAQDPALAEIFADIVAEALEVAFPTAALLMWGKRNQVFVAEALQDTRSTTEASARYQALWKKEFANIRNTWPAPVKLVLELERHWNAGSNPIANNLEYIVAERLRRRLCEMIIEMREIEALESRMGLPKRDSDATGS